MTATISEVAARAGKAPAAFAEFLRYFACSALALAVDSTLYWLVLRAGLPYPVAAAAGFVAGVSTAYALSVLWAFRRRRVADARLEFAIFFGIGLAGLALTESLLWLQIDLLGIGAMTAKLLSASGVFLFNFAARKLALFSRPNPLGAARDA
jgi:putative flippase GtrA